MAYIATTFSVVQSGKWHQRLSFHKNTPETIHPSVFQWLECKTNATENWQSNSGS